MTLLKPVHVAGDGVTPDRVRRALQSLAGNTEGILTATDFAVTEDDTPGMRVKIAAGGAWILGDSATHQGIYFVESDAAETKAISNGDATNDRIDVVIAEVRDSDYSGSDDDWQFRVVEGTPAGSPVAPAIPDTAIGLAEVTVEANESTSILTADITSDLRSVWPGAGGSVWGAIAGAAATAVANNTNTVIALATALGASQTSITATANRLIAPVAGVYMIEGAAPIVSGGSGSGLRNLWLRKNGVTNLALWEGQGDFPASTPGFGHISMPVSLAADDYVELIGFHTGGGNVSFGGSTGTYLMMERLGAAA